MNSSNDLMGDMRIAATTAATAANSAREAWEDGELMLDPKKAQELSKLLNDISDSLRVMKPFVEKFKELGESRTPSKI